jgi:hypothetical protein
MKHRVVTQAADLAVLLRYLSGEYRPSPSPRASYWIGAAIVLATGVFGTIRLCRWSETSGDDRSALIVVIVTALGVAVGLLNQAHTSYRFSKTHIERRGLLPLFSRRLPVANIHEGYVVVTEDGYTLELIPVEGRSLAIPLDRKLREDFAKLYTEIGPDPLTAPVLDARFRPVIYAIIGVVALVVILVTIELTRRGNLAW